MENLTRRIKERAMKQIEEEKKIPGAPEDVKPKKGAKPKYERPVETPDVFADADVCQLLGINRKALMRARKRYEKGKGWDVVEDHAGMTAAWILSVNPKADLGRIAQWAIQPGDGIVSVEVVQHTRDMNKLICRKLSDGRTVVVQVRDASDFLDGEQFDAQDMRGRYIWREELNRV